MKNKSKKKNKKAYLFLGGVLVILILIISPMVLINLKAREMEKYTEVTFVTPNDAIVFWKSEEETLGYIEYSYTKYGKKSTVIQTSSEKGQIHVVFLENIPKEGMFIRKINEGDSFLIIPKVLHVKYEGVMDEEI